MLGDLCLPVDDVDPALHRERVAALIVRGYDMCAAMHVATGRLTQTDRCSIEPLSAAALASSGAETKHTIAVRSGSTTVVAGNPVGAPLVTSTSAAASAPTSAAGARQPPCHFRQLTRLHFVAADAVQAAQLTSCEDVVRSYDILSITPKSDRLLHQACTSLDVDVISLELSSRLSSKGLKPASVKAALRRGIYFEICYAPGLRELTARRNLFCNAQALVRLTRGRNILLSSSARSSMEVRSPLELLHIATLFGLTHKQAQDAIRLAPKAVLARATARLAGRRAVVAAAPGTAVGPMAAAGAAAFRPGGEGDVDGDVDDAMEDVRLEGEEAAQSEGTQQQQQQARGSKPPSRTHTPTPQRQQQDVGRPTGTRGTAAGKKRPAAVR